MHRRPIRANVDLVKKIVAATVCLHNYLKLFNANYTLAGFVDSQDQSGNIIPGDWRHDIDIEGTGIHM